MKVNKKVANFFLFSLLLSVLAGAVGVFIFSPDDNFISLSGNLSNGTNFQSFICSVQASAGTNVSNVSRWDNSTGAWVRNQSNVSGFPKGEAVQNVTFKPTTNFTDSFSFIWACETCSNGTNVAGGDYCQNNTWTAFTNNRTVRIEFPPNVTLELPATGNKSDVASINLNFTPRSNFIGGGLNNNILDCKTYDNSSGSWTQDPLGITAINNTTILFPHVFAENNSISWNIVCAERNEPSVKAFAPANFTLLVDITNPTVVLNAPGNVSFSTSRTVLFNWTGTDRNIDTCSLYHNASGTWTLNVTNTTKASGSTELASLIFVADGNVMWGVGCNDTVRRTTFTNNVSLTIDTSGNNIFNFSNFTIPNTCTEVGITWNTSEGRNGSIDFGTGVGLGTKSTANLDAATSHFANLSFGRALESTLYNVNVTSCDAAGNCNMTANSVRTPLPLCNEGGNNAGWNAYAVLNNISTLGSLANDTGATFAYWWNATGQAWVFNQRNTAASAGVTVPYGGAVLLYSATNTTWFRNTSTVGNYLINLTTGDNFFGLTTDYHFRNLSLSLLNRTGGDIINVTDGGGSFNLTNNTAYFANWNNSLHNYLSYVRDFFVINTTTLPRGEVVWAWVEMTNVTWNGTAVLTNQSIAR